MFLNVITVTSLMVLSSAENQHQQPTKYAVSSQSFHREDVPLSYKYSAVHVYTTAKPIHIHGTQPSEDNQQKNDYSIQYAPLHPSKTASINPQSNQYSENSYKLVHQDSRKEYLEPRSTSERNFEAANKQFIPGHNIEVLQNINRSPGHNAVYRDSNQDFQYTKANYLQHFRVNMNSNPSQNSNEKLTNIWTSTTKTPSNSNVLLARQNLRSQLLRDDGVPENEDTKIPHPKAHRLHLNIAQQYGMAQMIPLSSNHILDPSNFEQTQLIMYLPQRTKNQQSINKNSFISSSAKIKNFLANAS